MIVTKGPWVGIYICAACGPTNRFMEIVEDGVADRFCIPCHPAKSRRAANMRHTTPREVAVR